MENLAPKNKKEENPLRTQKTANQKNMEEKSTTKKTKKTVEKEEGFKEDTALDLTKKVEANKCYQNKESHKAIKKKTI